MDLYSEDGSSFFGDLESSVRTIITCFKTLGFFFIGPGTCLCLVLCCECATRLKQRDGYFKVLLLGFSVTCCKIRRSVSPKPKYCMLLLYLHLCCRIMPFKCGNPIVRSMVFCCVVSLCRVVACSSLPVCFSYLAQNTFLFKSVSVYSRVSLFRISELLKTAMYYVHE